MENLCAWVNCQKIPFRGKFFLKPTLELYLPAFVDNISKIKEFFEEVERRVKEGYFAFGFLSYELGYVLEEKLRSHYRPPEVPLAYFCFFREAQNKMLWPLEQQKAFSITVKGLNCSPQEYESSIHAIKEYIANGDTYQVNYSMKLKFLVEGKPWDLFKALLFSQRCEYAAFLMGSEFVIVSLSPELFLFKKGNLLCSSPMKGTAARGFLLEEDQRLKEKLKEDPKSLAENVMIVDLIRNDFGKICYPGSVKVKELFKVKTYPTVHQMISSVEGILKDRSLFKIFKALFPCGSVTGAPKIRTMEIIRELEKEPRNIYTGAIGYITPRGDFVFNVAIRTAFLKQVTQDCFEGELGIGAGVVWESLAENEYQEMLLKASFFINPLPYFQLFETFGLEPNKENCLLKYHYKRLISSAKYFSFRIPKALRSFKQFKNLIEDTAKISSSNLRVRVSLTPDGEIGVEKSSILEVNWPQPLKVGFAKRKTPKSIFHYHKSTVREEYEFFRKLAQNLGLTEIIFFNHAGEILEGTISNFFLEENGYLYTPPIELGILPGVLRERLIKVERARERLLTLNDIQSSRPIYIGNSFRGLGRITEWVIL